MTSMVFLILAVLIGIGFAFFAVQNTSGVSVQLGTLSYENIPLYVVVLGSLLLGLAVSGILRVIDWAVTGMMLRGKDKQLHRVEENREQLQERVHELEEENARLREGQHASRTVDRGEDHSPSFSERLRQSFSH